MRFITVFILCIFCSNIYAQNVQLDWATPFGSKAGDEEGKSIDVDATGNSYTTGYFSGTVDFDPSSSSTYNLTSGGGKDIFVMKQGPSGNLIWAKRIGGGGQEEGNSIKVDKTGNVYVTGYFTSSVDFDPGNGAAFISANGDLTAYGDAFLLKLTNSGDYLWANHTGAYDVHDEGKEIALDEQDNVYVTGIFSGNMDVDPTSNGVTFAECNGKYDVFAYKLNASGTFAWGKGVGGPENDYASSIVPMRDGSVWIKGDFRDSADFNPDQFTKVIKKTAKNYVSNVFLLNLTSQGNFAQVYDFASCSAAANGTMVTDKDDNLYLAGQYYGTVDFDPGPSTYSLVSKTPYEDLFLLKLTSKGNFVWAKAIGGGSNQTIAEGLGLDKNGNIYMAGRFNGAADFDPGPNEARLVVTSSLEGNFDAFMVKLKADGSFAWANSLGNYYDDGINALDLDTGGTLYHTGFFRSTTNFNFNAATTSYTALGGKDLFVQKIRPCASFPSRSKVTACQNYTWSGQTYYISGIYRAVFPKPAPMCDSIAILDLTIVQGNTTYGTLNAKACSLYTVNGQTYALSGKYTQLLRNTKGCDSILTLNLTFRNQSTQVVRNRNELSAITEMSKPLSYQWYSYSSTLSPLSGQTNSTFNPSIDGAYAVVVTSGGCSDTSTYYSYQANCTGTTPNFSWGYSLHKSVATYAIATDAQGNVYTAGSFSDSVDFDPGEGQYVLYAKTNNAYIQKTDPKGKRIWTKQLVGELNYVNNMVLDRSGNLVLQGYFFGLTDFDPGPNSKSLPVVNSKDLFLLKLNSNGDFIWVRQIDDFKESADVGMHNKTLKVDASDNVYYVGFHSGTTDMDPGTGSYMVSAVGDYDIYLLKLNPAGDFIWAKNFGSSQQDDAYSLAVDANGTCYLAGAYLGAKIDLDPGPGSQIVPTGSNDSHYFIVKLNTLGNLIWGRQTNGEIPSDLAISSSGYIYACGHFSNTVYLSNSDPNLTLRSNGDRDGYVVKMDTAGIPLWAHRMGGSGTDGFAYLSVSTAEDVYLLGGFRATATSSMGTYMSSTGESDIAIIKVDPLGALRWARQIEGTYDNTPLGIITDPQENVISSGVYGGTIDLDLGPAKHLVQGIGSYYNYYVLKLSQCANELVTGLNNTSVISQSNASLFVLSPNPSNGYIKVEPLQNDMGPVDIVVRDLNGTEIHRGSYHTSQEFFVSASKGIYTVTIWKGDKPHVLKWFNN